MRKKLLACFLVVALKSTCAMAGEFDIKEIQVTRSPNEPSSIQFGADEKVADFDVSPAGPEVAALVRTASGDSKVVFWRIDRGTPTRSWRVPAGFAPRAIVWHPAQRRFFLTGQQGRQNIVMAVTETRGEWAGKTIYQSQPEIRRVIVGPWPFEIGRDAKGDKPIRAYRLFFGRKEANGAYAIRSITEEGRGDYLALGPKHSMSKTIKGQNEDATPSEIEAAYALPIGFHPAGDRMIWEDQDHCFNIARYDDAWMETKKVLEGKACGGSLTATPNGLGFIHWKPATEGVTIYYHDGKSQMQQARGFNFAATPSSVPDGRGVVGLVKTATGSALHYVPIDFPLADIVNAWMFVDSPDYLKLMAENGGVFKDRPDREQLYSIYEEEAYCEPWECETHAGRQRPNLVTTDIFWEVFASAFEGVFILKEKRQAIPAFWELVDFARHYFAGTNPQGKWHGVFTALDAARKPDGGGNPEAALILKAEGMAGSHVLGENFDYGELKPRGHYTSTPEMTLYFKAFKYLTGINKDKDDKHMDEQVFNELTEASPEVKAKAKGWMATYDRFISPPCAPLVWNDGPFAPPPYAKHPLDNPRLFPLSWGFDNEVLLSTVCHPWPPEEQVCDRMLPSGLDIAAATGSSFAQTLLADDLKEYPNLQRVLGDLKGRYETQAKTASMSPSLYDRWITALALQWAEDVASPNGELDQKLWRTKRLQSGLGSWSVLRHATVLVNERTSAEGSEGGVFEPLWMRPPRGYVEPDPRTFEAIAGLFDALAANLDPNDPTLGGQMQVEEAGDKREPLREAILKRLAESAKKARLFKTMAEKELRGEPLTDSEYEEILHVVRVAEHDFIIFKSLANQDFALSEPDPMPKIADVAGGGPFLLAGVGHPMEWTHMVPFFGRKEIVKGAVYSYYEFTSESLMNDEEWREKVKEQPHPGWIAPFLYHEKPAN